MSILIYFLFIPTVSLSFLFSFPLIFKLIQAKELLYLILGTVFYTILHNISALNNFINALYIISHELSHALAGILKGNKIKKIRISNKYGYVSFSKKPDKFTTIFPYIFPFYNILVLAIYLLLSITTRKKLYPYFVFLEGMLLMFYILNTISVITTPQNDFKKFGGRIRSVFFIITLNICVVMATLVLIFPEKKLIIELSKEIIKNYFSIITWLFSFISTLAKSILVYAFSKTN